jgi:hypothetical protein
MNHRITAIICGTLLLAACSPNDNQPAPKIFKDQIEVLDKAKAVAATQQEEAEKQRKAMEQQAQ